MIYQRGLECKNFGGDDLANNAIEKIKDAELNAKKILQKAQEEAIFLRDESRRKCIERCEKMIQNALQDAEKVKNRYQEEGEKIAKPIFEEAEKNISKIRNVEEGVLDSIVDLIVERIVSSNGNSQNEKI